MGKKSARNSISITSAMRMAINAYLEAEDIEREEFCRRTGYRPGGKNSLHSLSIDKMNRILPDPDGESSASSEAEETIKKPTAIRIARTLGLSLNEFLTGNPQLSGSIAADNGWEVSGKLEGSPRESPNGVSFLVRKVTHAETGTVGRGKFYCVSQFKMPERDQMHWRLTRHEIVGNLTAALDHPHLSSRIAAYSSADDYLVIDRWVDGRELSLQLLGNEPSAAFVRTTMKGVASALAALHEAGIVLRWLDPRGIVVTDEGHATLVDFEFAKLTGSFRTIRPEHQLPDSGYLAPQVREGLDIGSDRSADVYSWACILARLVSGKLPGVKSDRPKELIGASRLPARVRRLAEQCLETDPGKRPANGAELLKAIRRW